MDKNIDFGFVADLYDYYVTTDLDIAFYKDFCKGYKNILELMCGTGRVSLPLINEGFRLTCVDYSEEMLRQFRSKQKPGQSVDIICQDISKLSLDRQFDLIMIPFNSIAEITDKEKINNAFERIREHLLPGGTFFCTLYNPRYRMQSADGNMKYLGRFDIPGDRTLIVTYYNLYTGKEEKVTGIQFYEIYDAHNILIEKRFLNINFSLISMDEMCTMAKNTGFALKQVYGDYAYGPFNEAESRFMNFVFVKQRIG